MAHDHLTLQGLLQLVPDEAHAEALFLSARWPDGAVCRWCGSVGNARQLSGRKMLFHCRDCGRATSARAGTPMEASHLPVRTWLTAMFLMACSSTGSSARQLGFWLGLQYRTAWHLSHRIRRMDSPSAPRRGAMATDDPVLRGVVTDVSDPFAQKRAEYTPLRDKLAIDFGLSTLIATDAGDLMGRHALRHLEKLDKRISTIARHRQKAGLKVRSPRYDRAARELRGWLRTEIKASMFFRIEVCGSIEAPWIAVGPGNHDRDTKGTFQIAICSIPRSGEQLGDRAVEKRG